MITRPVDQLQPLVELVEQSLRKHHLDNQVFGLPLLNITPHDTPLLAKELSEALNHTDWLFFVSPNAFLQAEQLLKKYHYEWPSHIKLALIGGGSEAFLSQSSLNPKLVIKPANEAQWDSEGLLESLLLSKTNWALQKVLFIKGDGGREWLANQLAEIGAQIEQISLYSRGPLSLEDDYWQKLLQFINIPKNTQEIAYPQFIWLMTSSQACEYLQQGLNQLGLQEKILNQSVALATHEKIAQKAHEIGFSKVIQILPGPENIAKYITDMLEKSV